MDNHNNEVEEIKPTKFDDMGLREDVLRGIYGYGFETPSEIQSKAIPYIIQGKDIIAQSQSGTGKTGTFVIGALNRIDPNIKTCQAIIVVPTRELAVQIVDVCHNLGLYTGTKPVLCVGGSNIQDCRREIVNRPTIIVGTPGRIIDMIQRNYISTNAIKMLILDEADEMLSQSFAKQIRSIVETVPKDAQICLFSATMNDAALSMAKKIDMRNPVVLLIKQEELTLEGIRQYYINVDQERYKFDTFCDIYDMISISQSIVYVNSKKAADEIKHNLEKHKFTVSVIHSQLSPQERAAIMKEFRSGDTRILISTDLLSRGIDIQQVSIVINYDLPHSNNKESYIHRIGRSGRFGRKGVAINLITNRDFYKLEELERYYNTRIETMPANISHLLH